VPQVAVDILWPNHLKAVGLATVLEGRGNKMNTSWDDLENLQ
jgi:hypothetical protein